MRPKKIDKDTLKNPDVFVSTSDKIFNYVEHHFKTAITIAGGALLIAIVYVGYGYVQTAKEESAAEALYKPEGELKKAESNFTEARSKKPEADKSKKSGNGVEAPPPVDYAKDYAPLVGKIKTRISDNSGTKAALISALNLSYFLMQQKQYSEALEVLNLAKYSPSSGDDMTGFWLMHRGVVLLENNQYDAAIDAYQKVLGMPALGPFYPEAILKQGLCYELKGDLNRARESYLRLGREFPRTEASSTAEQYLRLLELKKQG